MTLFLLALEPDLVLLFPLSCMIPLEPLEAETRGRNFVRFEGRALWISIIMLLLGVQC